MAGKALIVDAKNNLRMTIHLVTFAADLRAAGHL
jgi:hypothetical protein